MRAQEQIHLLGCRTRHQGPVYRTRQERCWLKGKSECIFDLFFVTPRTSSSQSGDVFTFEQRRTDRNIGNITDVATWLVTHCWTRMPLLLPRPFSPLPLWLGVWRYAQQKWQHSTSKLAVLRLIARSIAWRCRRRVCGQTVRPHFLWRGRVGTRPAQCGAQELSEKGLRLFPTRQ